MMPVETLDDLRKALGPGAHDWLDDAAARVRNEPQALAPLFARAGRKLGKEPLPDAPGWTAGRAGRALLLAGQPAERVAEIYHHGDAAEKLAVLQALPLISDDDSGVPLLLDALRTNDTRLVAAALGPYARHLDAGTWRQGVIKCVFMGIPLAAVSDLEERQDAELAGMLRGLADERAAAGRDMSEDALELLDRLEKR